MPTKTLPASRGLPRYIFLEDLQNPGARVLSDPSTATLLDPIDFGFTTSDISGSEQWIRIERVTFVGFRLTSQCPPDTFFGLLELPNGLLIQILDDQGAVQEHFGTDTNPIKLHHDLGTLAGVDVDRDVSGAKAAVSVRWTLSQAGDPSTLPPGWTFRIRVQDDLSGIDKLTVMIQAMETPVR